MRSVSKLAAILVILSVVAVGWAFNTNSLDENKAACEARVSVEISMPDLDLTMKTSQPVTWHSLVDTIPPVSYTASVSATPTPLISEGRQVGTMESGMVKFRELVMNVKLSGQEDLNLHAAVD
jgi:hypothetical protein